MLEVVGPQQKVSADGLPTHVQLSLGVWDTASLFAFPGTDGTPSPAFDNVGVFKYLSRGPRIVTKEFEIARITRGEYYPATLQGREVGEILDYLERLEKGELGEAFRRRVEERYQIPLGISLVLLALSLLTPEGRRVRVEGTA